MTTTAIDFQLKVETDFARIFKHAEKNIVLVDFKPYSEVELKEAQKTEQLVLSLLDLTYPGYGITKLSEGTDMTTEARNYFAKCDLTQNHTMALAAVLQNLAHRLLYNFYLNFHQPNIPMKGFSSREQATNWLINQGA